MNANGWKCKQKHTHNTQVGRDVCDLNAKGRELAQQQQEPRAGTPTLMVDLTRDELTKIVSALRDSMNPNTSNLYIRMMHELARFVEYDRRG